MFEKSLKLQNPIYYCISILPQCGMSMNHMRYVTIAIPRIVFIKNCQNSR